MSGNRLLFVCHANLCRSPMAERLARLAIDTRPELAGARLSAASAGTHARDGWAMHADAARVVAEYGADGGDFRSRELTVAAVRAAAVVLTATREQRAAVVAREPAALRRTFTLRQFGRLAAAVEPARLAAVPPHVRLAALIGEMERVRGRLQPVAADVDDLADPVNGTVEQFRDCARRIVRSLDRVWTVIAVT